MKKNYYSFFTGGVLLLLMIFLNSCSNHIVIDSKGPIGSEEVNLIKIAFILMMVVVLPVFVMVIWFSIRYRANNKKATYKPGWAHSNKIEWVIWTVPIAIVAALSYLTWVKTHELDPYKPIKSEAEPIRIEVISTDWNWLFIYPDYNIAVTNHLVFPANRPLSFRLTSASVMTSFFIPQLGSQIYVMAGMETKLHLMADHEGTYSGFNFEYSGNGYADMNFDAVATSEDDFNQWIEQAKQSPNKMNMNTYQVFRNPSINYPVKTYSSVESGLFNINMMEYMGWMGGSCHNMDMDGTMNHMKDTMNMQHSHCSMTEQSGCECTESKKIKE